MNRLNRKYAITEGLLPQYAEKNEVQKKILHIGISAFFRAHLGMYTDAANRKSDETWGIYAIKTRAGGDKQIDALKEQDYLYSLLETGKSGKEVKVIAALGGAEYYPEHPERVMDIFTDEMLHIITTTVTEKGYCFDFAANEIKWSNDDIQHDLSCFKNVSAKARYSTSTFDSQVFYKLRTVIGIIAAGLSLRYLSGLPGLTLLCCDNMTDNGKMFKKAVLDFLGKVDEEFMLWTSEKCTFPSAMVDRIVPAMTEESYKEAREASGFDDRAAIVCESFAQWVIEDNFAGARPQWELGGAQFVKDVEPFEEMKLRMLNGSHSLIAYIGYLCGYETVDKAIADEKIRKMIMRYWQEEAMPTLQIPQSDLQAYAERLTVRFANPELKHRTWQIAMDGSQKIPYRWLKGLSVLRAKGMPYDIQALGIAAWIRYTGGVDEEHNAIEVKDPLSGRFKEIHAESNGDIALILSGYLSVNSVFARDLAEDKAFAEKIAYYLREITEKGLYTVVSEIA